jgi:hypothetical protein
MCKGMDYANTLVDTVELILDRRNILRKKLSELDGGQVDLLHKIENEDRMNVVQGYDLYKALHDLRKARREVKDELMVLESLAMKTNSIKANLVQARQQAKLLDDKAIYLHKNKVYKAKQLNLKADIRLEIKKLIGGIN